MKQQFNRELSTIIEAMRPNGTVLIAREDTIIFEQCFGYADILQQKTTTQNTQYLIGSVTKQFTAAALLFALYAKAKEGGVPEARRFEAVKSSLQHPISDYLPQNHAIWIKDMPAWANKVTLHQLLVHSSGIPNYTSLPGFENQTSPNAADLVSFFKNASMEFTPGSKFSYNNSGYFLLGIIISAITHQPLDVFMENIIFKPLEMTSTHLATSGTVIELQQSDPRFKNLARGYTLDLATTTPSIREVKQYALMQMPGAGGSMISTAADLLKWNKGLFTRKIIPKDLVDLMVFPHIQTEISNAFYGYGFEIKKSKGHVYYTHRGGIPGFRSILSYIPHSAISIVILSNVFGNRDSLKAQIEKISSTLPTNLSEGAKALRIDDILEQEFPIIVENNRKYQLTSLEDNIMDLI